MEIVSNSENKLDFILNLDDVGKFIGVLYIQKEAGKVSIKPDNSWKKASGLIGPVLPGPPRLLDFEITGDLYVGGYAKASGKYIGGYEGPSEYWWMKVTSDGKRIQITEPKSIPVEAEKNQIRSSSPTRRSEEDLSVDPRYYRITPGQTASLFLRLFSSF